MERVTIDLSDPADRQRYRCPNPGRHASWTPWNGTIWCKACADHHWLVDPVFDELYDAKTGELVSRVCIRFVEAEPRPAPV